MGDIVPLVVSFPELLEPVELVTEVIWIREESEDASQGVAVWVPPERIHERAKLAELARAANEAPIVPAYRVLLVEDNALVAATYSSALWRLSSDGPGIAGLSVATASDGNEALSRLRVRPPIDLVITDIFMPTMTGFALLEQMRADPLLAQIPIIVISGCGPGERDRAMSLGAKFFLKKPVKYQDIVATVGALLGATKRQGKMAAMAGSP